VAIGTVAAAVDDTAAFGQTRLLGQIVAVAVQVLDALGDQHALGVVPGARANAIPSVDYAVLPCVAQVCPPGEIATSHRLGQRLTIGVGPGQTSQVSTVAGTIASDEEGHPVPRLVLSNSGDPG
jgi:hypothetical protein